MKRGDKCRFRTNETYKWRYGFCTGHQHDKPLAKIAGGEYDGVWDECELFEWTDDDLRKFALGDEE